MMAVEEPLVVNREVALVDPSDGKPTKVEWSFTEDGEKVRVSTRTGRIIPIPVLAEQTPDYNTKAAYVERDKDTKEADATQITFQPTLSTFEMDIMQKMNITEERVPKKTWWYYVDP